ncbi:hypothetical protein [Yoonia sp. BS5-3]|uniref:Transmembrane protein n=1 Tax=Yoonia phaeophyticola TaxID=3137369 RepID=A0ABZ2UYX0_9RHOB
MYILRAFPFSFAILWRYALVLPIMVLVFCVYAIVAVMFGYLFGLISPAIAILMAAAMGMACSVMPAMIGTRIGMQAKGVQPRNSYASMILPAVGYGLFEGFCILLTFALAFGAVVMATPLTPMEILSINASGSDAVFLRLIEENAAVTLPAFAVAIFWTLSVRAALLVPFVGASVGLDPNGRAHTPFYGFGSGFWSLLILVILSYASTFLLTPILGVIAHLIGFGDSIALGAEQIEQFAETARFDLIGVEAIVLVSCVILITLWLFSLQCAGAVLVFMSHKKAYDIAHEDLNKPQQMPDEPPMPKTDMRELIRSRMPHHHR